jgi:uncharacterized protein YjiS (DUF1127 family)
MTPFPPRDRVLYSEQIALAKQRGAGAVKQKKKVEMSMSTNLNTLTAHGAAGHDEVLPFGQRLNGVIGRWLRARLDGIRQAMALRRTLHEISQLSERELADIGLQQDEIVRLRSSEVFMPRSWQAGRVSCDGRPS